MLTTDSTARTRRAPTLATIALALASGVAAQSPATTADALLARDLARGFSRSDWLVPIRERTCGERTERWAAGLDFKARFDTGVEFVPVLGEGAPHNLPVLWRTRSMRFENGALPIELVAASPAVKASDWRYELRHGEAIEAYDVRADGVEQTFVFAQPASVRGDLVVAGSVATELRGDEVAACHGAILFRDASGAPVVSYGAAFAIDAAGDRLPITSRLDGCELELRVPAAWLTKAAWPVTIDPLLARVTAGGGAFVTPASQDPSLVWDARNSRYVYTFLRPVSASDHDTYTRALDQDLDDIGFIDANNFSVDSRKCVIAYAQGADRYVWATEHVDGGFGWIELHIKDAPDPFTAGSIVNVPQPAGSFDSDPSIAGTTVGDRAYVAFRRDQALGNTDDSRVIGRTYDLASWMLGPETEHKSSNALVDFDAEAPSVSTVSDGGGWMIVWQEYNPANPSDDWDIIGRRLSSTGTASTTAVFGPGNTSTLHKYRPCVAGASNSYAVTYLLRANTGSKSLGSGYGEELEAQPFDWNTGANAPAILGTCTVSDIGANVLQLSGGTALAFDRATDSQWTVAWRREGLDRLYCTRFGWDGEIVESLEVEGTPASGSYGVPIVCHNAGRNEFVIAYGQDIQFSQNPVAMRQLVLGATSANKIGDGCQGDLTFVNHGPDALPLPGSRWFQVALTGARPSLPTWLLVCPGQGNVIVPLPPGCPLFFDLTLPVIQVAQGISSAAGNLTVPLAVPSTTGPLTFAWQFVQIDVTQVITSDAWVTLIP